MRSTGVIASVAVVASVAVFALLNSSSFPQGTNFLSKNMGPIEQEFVKYLAHHQKNYATKEEYAQRLATFTKKFIYIMKHNNSNGKKFEVGLNHMSDWTEEEFQGMLGYRAGDYEADNTIDFSSVTASEPVDWRDWNAVGPVKDQG